MTLELICAGKISKKEGIYEIKVLPPYQLHIVEESDSEINYEGKENESK